MKPSHAWVAVVVVLGCSGCSSAEEPSGDKTAIAITQQRLEESGQGPIGTTVTPDTVHLLVANYAISCAEPFGSEDQHVHTQAECNAAPDHVDWQLDIFLPPSADAPGSLELTTVASTVEAGKCGIGDPGGPELGEGTLTVSASDASAVHFELAGTDVETDGAYVATRCP
jgi:hypothetical protein